MNKLSIDQRLVQRCQSVATGADVHEVNNRLQRYYAHIWIANGLIKDKKWTEAQAEVSKVEALEAQLRSWWYDHVKR